MAILATLFRRHTCIRRDLGHSAQMLVMLLFLYYMGLTIRLEMHKYFYMFLRRVQEGEHWFKRNLMHVWWNGNNIIGWIIILSVIAFALPTNHYYCALLEEIYWILIRESFNFIDMSIALLLSFLK